MRKHSAIGIFLMTVLMWVIVPHEYFHSDHHDDQCTEADTHMHQTHKTCDACNFHFSSFSLSSPDKQQYSHYYTTYVSTGDIASPKGQYVSNTFLRGPPEVLS